MRNLKIIMNLMKVLKVFNIEYTLFYNSIKIMKTIFFYIIKYIIFYNYNIEYGFCYII
jgi:hypothetical protein